MNHTNDCVRQRAKFGARSKAGNVCSCEADYMIPVKRVKDAIGAYCLTCQRGIGEPWQVFPWSWRKSQVLHERSTGHKTIMYALK